MGTIKGLLIVAIVMLAYLCLQSINKINKKTNKLYNAAVRSAQWAVHIIVCKVNSHVPKDKDLVLFGADNGDGFAGNPKYLFLEAVKHPEIHSVWITKNRGVYKTMKGLGYEVYMFDSKEGRQMQLHAATLIHSHSIKEDFDYHLVSGATSVNTWHGVGLKQSWWRNKNSFAGQWMLSPPSWKRTFNMQWALTNMPKETFVIGTSEEVDAYYPVTYNIKADHVINMGQARNDVFYDASLEEGELPEVFKKGKVIVYMPTHRDYGAKKGGAVEHIGSNINFEKLSKMLEKYGYTFVIKQHRWNTSSQRMGGRLKNIVDISSQNYELDTQLLLKYTDILITDYSSVYTDFLLLDRPVMFYCYDLDEYLSEWDLNFDYDYVTPGPKAFDSDELIAELEKLLQGQDEYEAERQRVKRVFYSPENQGPVAKKQMDYIIKNIIKR